MTLGALWVSGWESQSSLFLRPSQRCFGEKSEHQIVICFWINLPIHPLLSDSNIYVSGVLPQHQSGDWDPEKNCPCFPSSICCGSQSCCWHSIYHTDRLTFHCKLNVSSDWNQLKIVNSSVSKYITDLQILHGHFLLSLSQSLSLSLSLSLSFVCLGLTKSHNQLDAAQPPPSRFIPCSRIFHGFIFTCIYKFVYSNCFVFVFALSFIRDFAFENVFVFVLLLK